MDHTLERQLDAHVPQWRRLTSDPAFSAWLSLEDRRTGRTRRWLFDRAAATGDAAGVAELMRDYLFRIEMRELDRAANLGMSPLALRELRTSYTRGQIRANYEKHRKGAFAGRESEWDMLERSMIDAAREGRVAGALPLWKNIDDGGR